MDPVTAIFNFLCTPVGQKLCEQIEDVVTDLVKRVHEQQQLALDKDKKAALASNSGQK